MAAEKITDNKDAKKPEKIAPYQGSDWFSAGVGQVAGYGIMLGAAGTAVGAIVGVANRKRIKLNMTELHTLANELGHGTSTAALEKGLEKSLESLSGFVNGVRGGFLGGVAGFAGGAAYGGYTGAVTAEKARKQYTELSNELIEKRAKLEQMESFAEKYADKDKGEKTR